MRKFLFAALLAVGIALVPSVAQASWLSQAWHRLNGDDAVYYDPGYYAPAYEPGYSYYDPGYYGTYVAPAYVAPSYSVVPGYSTWGYSPYRSHRGYYGGGNHHGGYYHGGHHYSNHHHH